MCTVTDLNVYRIDKMLAATALRPTCDKCRGHGFLRREPDPNNPHRDRIVPVDMWHSRSDDFVCWVCKGVGNLPAEGEAC